MLETINYQISEVVPYINWIYLFHAWGMPPKFAQISGIHDCVACRQSWLSSFEGSEAEQAREASKLYADAQELLQEFARDYSTLGRFGLYDAYSDGDSIVVGDVSIPMLRQQTTVKAGEPCLSLADFVSPHKPAESGRLSIENTVGVFATTVEDGMEKAYPSDPYRQMLVQTLCDRLAEATAEKLHEDIRKKHWGYVPEENLSMRDLLLEKYQGIRPAVGYPSMPDHSVIFLMDKLIDMRKIGIKLSETGAMRPHASVAGLMFAHPASRYFAIGHIGEDQLDDYSHRRGIAKDELRKYLIANLIK